jgi:hypothetical protein
LFRWPQPSGPPEHAPGQASEQPDARPAHPRDEQVPPGRDGTLLAMVPIPGTGTSLAIVGYAIATSPASEHAPKCAPEHVQEGVPATPEPTRPRRRRPPGSGLRMDYGQRRVWAGGREVGLTFREFELLAFLSAHPATVFTRTDLIEKVWRRAVAADSQAIARDSRTVDVHVSRVRHKLGPHYGQCLVTEYRVGYQFRPLIP